jgi:hypothetical protein
MIDMIVPLNSPCTPSYLTIRCRPSVRDNKQGQFNQLGHGEVCLWETELTEEAAIYLATAGPCGRECTALQDPYGIGADGSRHAYKERSTQCISADCIF